MAAVSVTSKQLMGKTQCYTIYKIWSKRSSSARVEQWNQYHERHLYGLKGIV